MSNFSRRRFLEDTLLASAAAVTAGSVAPDLLAAEPQSKSANERLSVAVVGVRGRGGSHLSAFSGRKDTEVTYVVDADEAVGMKRVAEVAKRQGRKPKFVKDMREAFEDKNLDIVTTATPNHWHALVAIWAMQAGKDVYTEKPVSHNVSEGRRMVEAARKYSRICQTGTQCRSMRGTIEAIEFVQSGKIGEVKLARGLCYKPRGSIGARGKYDVPESVDYNLWQGPAQTQPLTRPKLHYDWHWQWPYGNGDLGNQGIHQMDIARWGLDVDGLGESVLSYGGRFGYKDAGDTANTQVNIHNFGHKTLVFEVRGLKTKDLRGAKIGVIFYGTDGYVVLSSYTGGAAFDKDGKQIKKFSGGGDHFGNFVTAVRSRKVSDLNADIEEGHRSSALCHLGNISYRLGETVNGMEAKKRLSAVKTQEDAVATFERFTAHLKDNNVSLEKTPVALGPQLVLKGETFTGTDAEQANLMLTREYRKPFVVPTTEKL